MSNSAPPRITPDNLDDIVYVPKTGVEYELTPDCIRVMKKVTFGLDMDASDLMDRENIGVTNKDADGYSPRIRLEVVKLVTGGDPLPEDPRNIDLDIVNRIVADFFTRRIARPAKQPI